MRTRITILILTILFFILSACTPAIPQATLASTITSTATSTPTITPSPMPTMTPTPDYSIDPTKLNQFFKSYDDLMTNYKDYQEQPNPLTDKAGWDASMTELKMVIGPPSEMGVCITTDAQDNSVVGKRYRFSTYDMNIENTKVTYFMNEGKPVPILWCNINHYGLHGFILYDGEGGGANSSGVKIIDFINNKSKDLRFVHIINKTNSQLPEFVNDLVNIGLDANSAGADENGVSVGPVYFEVSAKK
jgi:hypothetical protein